MFELLHVVLVSGYQSWREGGGVSGLLGAQVQSHSHRWRSRGLTPVHGEGEEGGACRASRLHQGAVGVVRDGWIGF